MAHELSGQPGEIVGLAEAFEEWLRAVVATGDHADPRSRDAFDRIRGAMRKVDSLYAQQLLREHGLDFSVPPKDEQG